MDDSTDETTRIVAREALAHAFGDAYERGSGSPDYHAAEIALGALEREGIVLHAGLRADGLPTVNPAGAPRVSALGAAADVPVSPEEFDEVSLAVIPRISLHEAARRVYMARFGGDAA